MNKAPSIKDSIVRKEGVGVVPSVDPPGELSAYFIRFCETAELIAATTIRLEKAGLLAAFFTERNNDDLVLVARYFAGYAFPLRDQRTTNIGGSALLTAILAVTQAEEATVRGRAVALGDLGDVAQEAFAASGHTISPHLTLGDVAAALAGLASTAGTKNKGVLMNALLARATALEAKYLVKLVGGDLRIGLQEGAVEDAIARWAGVTVGQVQWVNMLTGDIGETALRARAKDLETARMRLFHPLKFMLATPAADLPDVARQMPEEFVVEDKFDGIRAQAHIGPDIPAAAVLHGVVHNGVRVALFSRTLDEITGSFPDLVAPLATLLPPLSEAPEDQGLILDGEIVPVTGERILPFQDLQKRLGRKEPSAAMMESVPVAFVAYDALYARGKVILDRPFAERREVLDALPPNAERTRKANSVRFRDVALLDAEFDAARARGNEGLMVKDPASSYKPGRRGRDWLKIKRALATLDMVVTSVEVGNGKRHNVLSDYTFAVRASETDPTLLNVGKAYSGLTDVEIAELSDWFRAHTLQEFAHGKVRLVEPQVVLEITFDRVQVSKRHKSGYALRFPRILRVRDDKPASQIDTLDAVRKLVDAEGAVEEPDENA